MRITKLGHACVRIEHDGHTVVLDPGAFTERQAVDGATAILITHEHVDHLDLDHLRATDAPIWTIEAVRAQILAVDGCDAPDVAERVTVVAPGQRFDVGLPVTAVGQRHAVIHEDLPRFDNSGFLLDVGGVSVFHPGDAFTVPEAPVDLLFLPLQAPWSKMSEVADFARAVGARRSVAVHDGLLNDTGLAVVGRNLSGLLDTDEHRYQRIAPGCEIATG